MKTQLVIGLGMILATTACQNKEESSPAPVAAVPAAANTQDATDQAVQEELASEQSEAELKEASISELESHRDDIRALQQAALGNGGSTYYPEISNSANLLATHYEFEVLTRLEDGDFRMASFQWDLGEVHFKRLQDQIAEGSVNSDVGSAWGTYMESRESILESRDIWGRF